MKGSTPQVVDTMLALKAIHVAELADGTKCYVQAGIPTIGNGRYYLDKFSGAAENLGTGAVVAPLAGSPIAGAANARWLLCPCGALPG